MSDEEWLSITDAADRIQRTERQVRRYVQSGRVRSRRRGQHVEYNGADLDVIAAKLPQGDERHRPPRPKVLPSGELLAMIEGLQQQMAEAAARETYLRGQLDQRPQLADQQQLAEELVQTRTERNALQAQLTALQSSGRQTWILAIVALVVLGGVLVVVLAIVLLR